MREIAGGVRRIEVHGWRNPAATAGEGTDGGLDGTARAEGGAEVALGAAERQPVGMVAEDLLDGPGLCGIVQRGGGAVRVDVADLVGGDPTFRQRVAHRAGRLAPIG